MVCVSFFAVGMSNNAADTAEAERIARLEATKQEIVIQERTDFQTSPEKTIKEISDLIKAKDFSYAKTKAERLLDTNDAKIRELYETASSGLENTKKAQQEAAQAEYALTGQALDRCKSEIAKFVNADGAGQIPDVQNYGSGNEFVYGWPRGTFQIATAFGTVDLSASCDGSLKPMKVMSLSINGKTVMVGGKKVL